MKSFEESEEEKKEEERERGRERRTESEGGGERKGIANRKPTENRRKSGSVTLSTAIVFRLGSAKRQILFAVRETRQEIYGRPLVTLKF